MVMWTIDKLFLCLIHHNYESFYGSLAYPIEYGENLFCMAVQKPNKTKLKIRIF